MGLTAYQKDLAMVVTAKVSGSASIVGSSLIIADVYKKWKRKGSNDHFPATTLLVLSMSISDLGCSFFSHFIGSWMVPNEGGFPLSSGNEATCEAQAFLFSIFYSSGYSTNGLLALVYWLTICREKSEKDLRATKWKALLYVYPWAYGATYATAARWAYDPTYYPMSWYCWSAFGEPGSVLFTVAGVICLVTYVVVTMLIIGCMASLIRFVFKTEQRMSRFNRSSQGGVRNSLSDKMVQVTKQGLLYIVAWMVIMIPQYVNIVAFIFLSDGDFSKVSLPNWFYVVFAVLFPLQGFLNAMIYFRPKVHAVKKRENCSILRAWIKVLGFNEAPVQIAAFPRTLRSSMRTSLMSTRSSLSFARMSILSRRSTIIPPHSHNRTEAQDGADDPDSHRVRRESIERFAGIVLTPSFVADISLDSDSEESNNGAQQDMESQGNTTASSGRGSRRVGRGSIKRLSGIVSVSSDDGSSLSEDVPDEVLEKIVEQLDLQANDGHIAEQPENGALKEETPQVSSSHLLSQVRRASRQIKRASVERFTGIVSAPSEADVEQPQYTPQDNKEHLAKKPDCAAAQNENAPEGQVSSQIRRESRQIRRESIQRFAGVNISFSSDDDTGSEGEHPASKKQDT